MVKTAMTIVIDFPKYDLLIFATIFFQKQFETIIFVFSEISCDNVFCCPYPIGLQIFFSCDCIHYNLYFSFFWQIFVFAAHIQLAVKRTCLYLSQTTFIFQIDTTNNRNRDCDRKNQNAKKYF